MQQKRYLGGIITFISAFVFLVGGVLSVIDLNEEGRLGLFWGMMALWGGPYAIFENKRPDRFKITEMLSFVMGILAMSFQYRNFAGPYPGPVLIDVGCWLYLLGGVLPFVFAYWDQVKQVKLATKNHF